MRIKRTLNHEMDEVAADSAATRLAVSMARKRLESARAGASDSPGDETALAMLARDVGRLGDMLRLTGEFEESEALLREAIEMWSRLEKRRAGALASLRMALAFRTAARYKEADALLTRLLEDTHKWPELSVYQDFILHHRGINTWRMGDARAGLKDLQAALKIRKSDPPSRTTSDTEMAIAKVLATSEES